jgi:hypothetical protein
MGAPGNCTPASWTRLIQRRNDFSGTDTVGSNIRRLRIRQNRLLFFPLHAIELALKRMYRQYHKSRAERYHPGIAPQNVACFAEWIPHSMLSLPVQGTYCFPFFSPFARIAHHTVG